MTDERWLTDPNELVDIDLARKVVAEFEDAWKLLKPYQPAFDAVAEASRELAAALPDRHLLVEALRVADELADFQRRVTEELAFERDFLPKMASRGWLISPLVPWDEPRRLHELHAKGGWDAVDRAFLDEYDADDFEVLVKYILDSSSSFQPWSTAFGKALDAMKRDDHELAIPIWLAGIDGICRSELGIPAYSQFGKKRRRAMHKALVSGLEGVPREPLVIAWLEVLLGFSLQSGTEQTALLNRHAVMHGLRPAIGDRRDALQCLLALHVLAYLLAERDGAPFKPRGDLGKGPAPKTQ